MFSGHISIRPAVRARDKSDHLRRLRAGRRRHLYGTAHQAGLEQRLQLRICDLTNSSHAGQREGSNPVLLVQGTCTTSYGMYSVQSYNGSFTLHGTGNDGFQYIIKNSTHYTVAENGTRMRTGPILPLGPVPQGNRYFPFPVLQCVAVLRVPIPCTSPCPIPVQYEYAMTLHRSVVVNSY